VLHFAAGQASATLSVPGIVGDLLFEGDETFRLELVAASTIDASLVDDAGLRIDDAKAFAIGTIIDNEARIDIQNAVGVYNNATPVNEGQTLTFTVVRTGYLDMVSTVTWDVAYRSTDFNGMGDFVGFEGLPSGEITFNPGQSEATITLTVAQDSLSELDEVFRIKLNQASEGTSIGAFNSFFKVVNDDKDQIRLSAPERSQLEGEPADAAATDYVLTLTRDNPHTTTTVNWVAEGVGDHPLDTARLVHSSGTATFAVGELTTTFVVSVLTDDVADFDRTFAVRIADPVVTLPNGSVDNSVGAEVVSQADSVTMTVVNDDPAIRVQLTSPSFMEGTGTNTSLISFRILRSGDATGSLSVDWALQGYGEQSTNIADFGGYWPSGTTVFNDGETVKLVQVAIAPDSNYEPDEGFEVVLSNLVSADAGARILVDRDQGVIRNDDTGVFVTASAASVVEGQSVDFTISAQGLPNRSVKVYWVIEGTGLSPTNHDDFDEFIGNFAYDADKAAYYVTLQLNSSGQAATTVTVVTADDNVLGPDETFRMRVVSVENGTIAQGRAEVTLLNNDALVSIDPATLVRAEGQEGDETEYVFTLTRVGDISGAATVRYSVEGFGDNPASPDDFVSAWSGVVTFAAGEAYAPLVLRVKGDNVFESDESFLVRLSPESATSNTQIAPSGAMAIGVIQNDDLAGLEVKALVAMVKEGTPDLGGSSSLSFEIVRNGNNSEPLNVSYILAPVDGGRAAVLADDLVDGLLSGTFTLDSGQSRYVLNLEVQPNNQPQEDRYFQLLITAPGYADPAPVLGTIVDDDSGITLSAQAATLVDGWVHIPEGTGTDAEQVFVVSRTGANLAATTLNWTVMALGVVNPVNAEDFVFDQDGVLPYGKVVFEEGQLEATLTIIIKADNWIEANEAFRIQISHAEGADTSQKILVDAVDALILNDDEASNSDDLIYGGNGVNVIDGLGGNDTIYGGSGADLIRGGDGRDEIWGMGGADFISGGAGDDVVHLNADNVARFTASQPGEPVTQVHGGAGFDTLVLHGNNILDLTEMPAIRSIEKIDLQVGRDAQTLRLDAASLQALFEAETPTLWIQGDADDRVEIMDFQDWNADDSHEDYNRYAHDSGAQLHVAKSISVVDATPLGI
jgi:Ca2+-binding RTX toxin-like protein